MDASIIICTYNRAHSLAEVLSSLCRLNAPEDIQWEVLVVDNNSSDETARVVDDYVRDGRIEIRYILEEQQGKSFALNAGIQRARGRVLLFTDDDVTIDSHWLTETLKMFKEKECLAVGGRIVPVWRTSKPNWISFEGRYRLMSAIVSFDMGSECCPLTTPPFGANVSFKRETFTKYGLFRTDLGPQPGSEIRGEDTEFCRRLLQANDVIYYAPNAIVYHPVDPRRATKNYYSTWYFDYGRASARVEKIAPDLICYWGIPRYKFREASTLLGKWMFSMNPVARAFYRFKLFEVLGGIVELYGMRKMNRA